MKAVITGGLGFVGGYLERLLDEEDAEIWMFDRQQDAGEDIRDYEALRTSLESVQPTHVFHLAAQAYVREGDADPRRALEVNGGGTLNLLEAVRHTCPDARVLLAGTSEEYGYANQPGPTVTELSPTLPTTAYGASKLTATTLGQVYAQRYGMRVVCTRAFNHTGPGQQYRYAVPSFVQRVVAAERGGPPVRHGNLDAIRNWTDVRDVVKAYRLAIDAPPGIYNVCSPWDWSMRSILEALVGRAVGTVTLERDDRLWHPSGSEVWHPPSAAKLEDATGWEPQITPNGTLVDMLNHERSLQR